MEGPRSGQRSLQEISNNPFLLVIPAKAGRALQQRSWSSKLLFRKIKMDCDRFLRSPFGPPSASATASMPSRARLTGPSTVEKRLAGMTPPGVFEVPKGSDPGYRCAIPG
jgi:hypothetical protein